MRALAIRPPGRVAPRG